MQPRTKRLEIKNVLISEEKVLYYIPMTRNVKWTKNKNNFYNFELINLKNMEKKRKTKMQFLLIAQEPVRISKKKKKKLKKGIQAEGKF